MTEHLCVDCGCDISDKHYLRQRCDACIKKRDKIYYQRQKEQRQKNTQGTGWGLAPEKYAGKCQRCIYWAKAGFCDFYYQTGRTRTSLHPPGEKLNNPCKEFEPRGGTKECKKSPFASDSIAL